MPTTSTRRRGRPTTQQAVEFTLGWELEANKRARRTPNDIECCTDASVSGDSVEYKIFENVVTDPTKVLTALQNLTHDPQIRVDRSCGYHVHIGLQNQSATTEKLFASWMVALARQIEEDAFNAVPESRRRNQYCRRFGTVDTRSVMARTYDAHKYGNDSRYYWVNVVEMFRSGGINTVEIRLLGNVRRFSYLLAWTSVCQLMAKSAWRLMSDPSAMIEETNTLKRYFETIKTNILSNTDAARSVRSANELATLAGYAVRASARTDALPDTGLSPSPARTPRVAPEPGRTVPIPSVTPAVDIIADETEMLIVSYPWVAIPMQGSLTPAQYLNVLQTLRLDLQASPATHGIRLVLHTLHRSGVVTPLYQVGESIRGYLNTLRSLLANSTRSQNSERVNTTQQNQNTTERRSLSCVE